MDLVKSLNEIDSIRKVKPVNSNKIKIKLFTKSVGASEYKDIKGDLRSISTQISSCLDKVKENGNIEKWKFVVKPKKRYQETSLNTEKISDRKSKGYKPAYYEVWFSRE